MRINASAGTTASRMAVRLHMAAGAGTGQRPGIQVTLQEVRPADSARIEDQQVSEGTGGGRCTSPRRDKSRQSEECWQPQPYLLLWKSFLASGVLLTCVLPASVFSHLLPSPDTPRNYNRCHRMLFLPRITKLLAQAGTQWEGVRAETDLRDHFVQPLHFTREETEAHRGK